MKISFKGIVPFGVMNKGKTMWIFFEEKVAHPKIKKAVYVNSFSITGKLLKNQPKGYICQYIANAWETPEEVPVMEVVAFMIMNKIFSFIAKLANNMTICGMVIIMFMESV